MGNGNGNKKNKDDKCKDINGKLLKKFDLEHAVACGPLRIDLKGRIAFDNITLVGDGGDYLIHVIYSPKEKNPRYEIYKKKE